MARKKSKGKGKRLVRNEIKLNPLKFKLRRGPRLVL